MLRVVGLLRSPPEGEGRVDNKTIPLCVAQVKELSFDILSLFDLTGISLLPGFTRLG